MLAFDVDFARGREADCRLCQRPEFAAQRALWGCDAPRREPWLRRACFQCKPATQPYCQVCHGTGEIAYDRCESHYVGPRESFVIDAVVMLEAGIAPFEGSLGDWPASFVDAVHLVASERNRILREKWESN